MGTKIKTPVTELRYVAIDGEGKNNAMPGEPARMQYVVSTIFKENSKELKAFESMVEAEWQKYVKEFNLPPKLRPKTNGIKRIVKKTPDGEEIPTDEFIATFKTNTTWKDGKPQIIKVYTGSGSDITEAVRSASWKIGNGSTGVVHGTADGNNIGGTHKVTLYLTAVQLATLEKYEGATIELDEIDGDDIDLGDDSVEGLAPNL